MTGVQTCALPILAGIDINTTKVEDEEYICYTMRIPKKSAYRTHSA